MRQGRSTANGREWTRMGEQEDLIFYRRPRRERRRKDSCGRGIKGQAELQGLYWIRSPAGMRTTQGAVAGAKESCQQKPFRKGSCINRWRAEGCEGCGKSLEDF
jgi:hypothetical protein